MLTKLNQAPKMTKCQNDLLDKLSFAVAKLFYQGEGDLAEKLSDIVDALSNQDFVLAVIIAKISGLSEKLVYTIQRTYQVPKVD